MRLYGGHDRFQRDDVLQARVQRDDVLQAHVVSALHQDDKRATKVLTLLAKKLLQDPYTIDDVASFIRYLDHELEWRTL